METNRQMQELDLLLAKGGFDETLETPDLSRQNEEIEEQWRRIVEAFELAAALRGDGQESESQRFIVPPNAREEVNQNDADLESMLQKRTGGASTGRRGQWNVERDQNGEIVRAWTGDVRPDFEQLAKLRREGEL